MDEEEKTQQEQHQVRIPSLFEHSIKAESSGSLKEIDETFFLNRDKEALGNLSSRQISLQQRLKYTHYKSRKFDDAIDAIKQLADQLEKGTKFNELEIKHSEETERDLVTEIKGGMISLSIAKNQQRVVKVLESFGNVQTKIEHYDKKKKKRKE